jgi:hypothetical protein
MSVSSWRSEPVACKYLGSDHFDRLNRSKAITRLVRRLQHLGCGVKLTHLV